MAQIGGAQSGILYFREDFPNMRFRSGERKSRGSPDLREGVVRTVTFNDIARGVQTFRNRSKRQSRDSTDGAHLRQVLGQLRGTSGTHGVRQEDEKC